MTKYFALFMFLVLLYGCSSTNCNTSFSAAVPGPQLSPSPSPTASPTPISTPAPVHNLRLTLLDEDNQPYTGATIVLTPVPKSAKGDISWVSRRNEINNLEIAAGEYVLSVPGYTEETAEFAVVDGVNDVVVRLTRSSIAGFRINFKDTGGSNINQESFIFDADQVAFFTNSWGYGGFPPENLSSYYYYTFPVIKAGPHTLYVFNGTYDVYRPKLVTILNNQPSPLDVDMGVKPVNVQLLRLGGGSSERELLDLQNEIFTVTGNGSSQSYRISGAGPSSRLMEFYDLPAGTYAFAIPEFSDETKNIAVTSAASYHDGGVRQDFTRLNLPFKLKIYKPENADGTYDEIVTGAAIELSHPEITTPYNLVYRDGGWTTADGMLPAGNRKITVLAPPYTWTGKLTVSRDNTEKAAVLQLQQP